jgi:hypothetical protein
VIPYLTQAIGVFLQVIMVLARVIRVFPWAIALLTPAIRGVTPALRPLSGKAGLHGKAERNRGPPDLNIPDSGTTRASGGQRKTVCCRNVRSGRRV